MVFIIYIYFRLLQQLKEAPLKTNGHAMASSKITMAFDAIQAIKLLRREVVDAMKILLNLAKDKQTAGMMPICNDMISKVIIFLKITIKNLFDVERLALFN